MKTIVTYLIFLLACLSNTPAQWKQCNGPKGGMITSFVKKENTIYAGTNSGLYYTTNNGASWKFGGLTGGSISSIISADNILFVSTYNMGVFRSPDNGLSWQEINNGLPSQKINCLTKSGIDLVAGTDKNGVYVSWDNGGNWHEVKNISTLSEPLTFLQTGKSLFLGCQLGSILYKSTDDGLTWSPVNIAGSFFVSFLVQHDSAVFAIVDDAHLYKSTDDGDTWKPINLPTTEPVYHFATDGKTMFVHSEFNLFRSSDSGNTWTNITFPKMKRQLFRTIEIFGSKIFLGIFGFESYTSIDNGSTWDKMNLQLNNQYIMSLLVSNSSLFAGTYMLGAFKSKDKGNTWENSRPEFNYDESLFITQIGSTIYAGMNNGLYFSSDNGETWPDSNTLLLYERIQAIAKCDTFVFAATESHGIYRSIYDAKKPVWEKKNTGLTGNFTSLGVGGSEIYAGTNEGLLFKSKNNGESWEQLPVNTNNKKINSIIISDSNVYIASEGKGIYQSTDNGNSWSEFNTGLPNLKIKALIKCNKFLFAATEGDGVFSWYLDKNGIKWNELWTGLPNKDVRSLCVMDGNLYAGTFGSGIWKYNVSYWGVSDEKQNLLSPSIVCYPNPTTNSLTIDRTSLQFPENEPVHYTLTTLIGGKVMELDNSEPMFTVLLEGMASGVYCLAAENGGNRAAVMVTVAE